MVDSHFLDMGFCVLKVSNWSRVYIDDVIILEGLSDQVGILSTNCHCFLDSRIESLILDL